jgi:hypothetical protein
MKTCSICTPKVCKDQKRESKTLYMFDFPALKFAGLRRYLVWESKTLYLLLSHGSSRACEIGKSRHLCPRDKKGKHKNAHVYTITAINYKLIRTASKHLQRTWNEEQWFMWQELQTTSRHYETIRVALRSNQFRPRCTITHTNYKDAQTRDA